mmetsp:Transcript_25987/g.70319  ORF Transcript_25987/g.70319 Transcript_25987/m.70319 type:complete len:270 (-) Transcript_25987:193-1002(-)
MAFAGWGSGSVAAAAAVVCDAPPSTAIMAIFPTAGAASAVEAALARAPRRSKTDPVARRLAGAGSSVSWDGAATAAASAAPPSASIASPAAAGAPGLSDGASRSLRFPRRARRSGSGVPRATTSFPPPGCDALPRGGPRRALRRSVSPYQRLRRRFSGLTSCSDDTRKRSCSPLPRCAFAAGMVRQASIPRTMVGSRRPPSGPGSWSSISASSAVGAQSASVVWSRAVAAASALWKTTFADESLIHSTHCGSWAMKMRRSSLVESLSVP